MDIEDAIKALTQPGSILKETECFAVIHRFLDYLNQQVAEGNGFLSPYFRLTLGLRGVFKSEHDTYDPRRHRPGVNFRPAREMQQSMRNMKVQHIYSETPAPEPIAFEDWESGTKNQTISTGKVGLVKGDQLKVTEPEDPEQGVFLVHLPTQQVYRAEGIYHNYPKKILFPIPKGLPTGQYRLEVRSAFSTSREIRSGLLSYMLTVL